MSAEQLERIPSAPGHIGRQVSPPLSKAWAISLKSIKIRLARSLITASGIFLGIAFFSSVRTSGLFKPGVGPEAVAQMHRQQWLAIMALLVCFVGITNAMLMSVTERFKEIGTMKCLGALNSFVVTLFFIEAALMGIIASFTGWLAGWGVIVLLHLVGDRAFGDGFLFGSLMQMIQSVVIGVSITLLAAIPPANRAAQMPPAVALRSEI